MDEKYVVNIFWSNGYTNGGLVYVLYSDNTYDAIRTKHHPDYGKYNHFISFRKYADLKVLRIKKYTKTEAINYIQQKDKEFEELG